MPKIFLLTFITISLFLVSTKQALAAFDFTTNNNQITDTQELEVTLNIDLSTSTAGKTYYLRGAFFKEGTTKYFGYTINNNGNPYNGPYSNCQELPSAQVDQNGDWSGSVKVKVDLESAYFEGSGQYLFKIGRYTESCGSVTWADTTPINIAVTQTTWPSPSPAQTLQKSSSPTPAISSSKSIVSTKPSPKITPAPKTILGEKVESQEVIASQSSTILESPSPITTPSSEVQNQDNSKTKIANIAIGIGISLIGLSAMVYLILRKKMSQLDDLES